MLKFSFSYKCFLSSYNFGNRLLCDGSGNISKRSVYYVAVCFVIRGGENSTLRSSNGRWKEIQYILINTYILNDGGLITFFLCLWILKDGYFWITKSADGSEIITENKSCANCCRSVLSVQSVFRLTGKTVSTSGGGLCPDAFPCINEYIFNINNYFHIDNPYLSYLPYLSYHRLYISRLMFIRLPL